MNGNGSRDPLMDCWLCGRTLVMEVCQEVVEYKADQSAERHKVCSGCAFNARASGIQTLERFGQVIVVGPVPVGEVSS
jgi:hypothetical protein